LGHKNALLNPGQEPTEVSGEIAKIACEFDISLLFPPEVLEEAKKFPKSLSEEMIKDGLDNGRVDFRNELVYTIDGKDTKDIDDAISVKILPNGNYELAVHIADVSHYVKPGSAIWKEAERRGNSNYLGNKVIPMLPVELSNGICSLNPNEDRFTTSCIMEIDHSGKVVNKKVCKGIIKSKKKMNYDAVQALMDKDYDSEELFATNEYTLKDTNEATVAIGGKIPTNSYTGFHFTGKEITASEEL
jgi:ribonuclease R